MKECIYEVLAATLRQAGDLDGAFKTANQASGIRTTEAADGHASMRMNLGNAINTKGMILGRADAEPSLGRSREALADFQKALDIAEELTKRTPTIFSVAYAEAN